MSRQPHGHSAERDAGRRVCAPRAGGAGLPLTGQDRTGHPPACGAWEGTATQWGVCPLAAGGPHLCVTGCGSSGSPGGNRPLSSPRTGKRRVRSVRADTVSPRYSAGSPTCDWPTAASPALWFTPPYRCSQERRSKHLPSLLIM